MTDNPLEAFSNTPVQPCEFPRRRIHQQERDIPSIIAGTLTIIAAGMLAYLILNSLTPDNSQPQLIPEEIIAPPKGSDFENLRRGERYIGNFGLERYDV